MKLRTFSLATLLVFIAACGGNSESSSRNRNGLLDSSTTLATATTTSITGSTLPTSPTTTATLTVATTTVPEPQVTTTTGPALIVPTPTSTSTSLVTTTTVPKVIAEAVAKTFSDIFPTTKTCALGGMCKLGDIGPGGGIVFNISEAGFETPDVAIANHFVEMAPINSSSLSKMRCNENVGNKALSAPETTKWLVDRCNLRRPSGPRLSGWTLPNAEDVYPLIQFFQDPSFPESKGSPNLSKRAFTDSIAKLTATYFLTSVPNDCRDIPVQIFFPANLSFQIGSSDCIETSTSWNGGIALAVRSFGPTTRSCAVGGPCKPGDVGPHGGIVISPTGFGGGGSAAQTTIFLEAMTVPEFLSVGPWCGPVGEPLRNLPTKPGSGEKNTKALMNDRITGLPCDVTLLGPNQRRMSFVRGFIPSVDELKDLCKVAKGLKRLAPLAQRQCGLSSDYSQFDKDDYARVSSSRCPIAIVCKENMKGVSARGTIGTIWTSSTRDGKPFSVKFDGTIVAQDPYILNNQTFNDSRAVTIPFYSFEAVSAR